MTASASVVEALRILELIADGWGVIESSGSMGEMTLQAPDDWDGDEIEAVFKFRPHPAEQDAREAVAWRVKDYADGWILFHHEAPARKSAEARNGALVQPLYDVRSEHLAGEVTDEWADRFCEAVNWEPAGQECKTVEGELRCATFRQIAKGYILSAIATDPHPLLATQAAPDGWSPIIERLLAMGSRSMLGLNRPIGSNPTSRTASRLNGARRAAGRP